MKNIFVLFLIVCLSACSSNTTEAPVEGLTSLPEFNAFYEQFHSDSLFQMEHIIFPLEGLPANADSLTFAEDNFRWQKEDWLMHRSLEDGAGFSRDFQVLGDQIVVEYVRHSSGQVGMIRRFAKMGDKWYLIYYAGLNRLKGAPVPNS